MLDWLKLAMILALFLGVVVVIMRFIFVPAWKKRKILNAQSYCPSILLPEIDKKYDAIIEVPSYKNDHIYKVNLFYQNCTCRRFNARRGHFPHGDIRRLCRHLRKELIIKRTAIGVSEMLQCIIEKRVRDKCYLEIEIKNHKIAIGFHPKSDFVRIYTRKKAESDPPDGPLTGPYDKFTLIVSQGAWVYGAPPLYADQILAIVIELLKKNRALMRNKRMKLKFWT
ncbi:MAG: hypothetical protein HQL71_10350 [Magnetococcales bacterium]|nr:hypothetical protein [Magnetococcales bacterium]